MKVSKWLFGSMAAGLVLWAQADVVLTHRYDFDGDANDFSGATTALNGTLSSAGTNLEAPLFSTDRPTDADTSFASGSIELGMTVGSAASFVNFGSGAQTRIYDGDSGSVAYWFKADQLNNGRDMFSNISAGSDGFRVMTRTDGGIGIAQGPGGQDFLTGDVDAGVWHHFAITWDDTLGTGTIAVDGVSTNYTFTAGALDDPSRLMLGNFANNDTQLTTQFDGHFYDLQIYEGELSSSEISTLANNAGLAIPEPTVVGLMGVSGLLALLVRRIFF